MPHCHGPGRPPRLPRYDHTLGGCYFVTICTEDRECLFGRVRGGRMKLSDSGRAVHEAWQALPDLHPGIRLDPFVVMPNHVHGVLIQLVPGVEPDWPAGAPPRHKHLGAVVRTFKSRSAVAVNRILGRNGSVWQRGYYEHVIGSDRAHLAISAYIERNPEVWDRDVYHRPG